MGQAGGDRCGSHVGPSQSTGTGVWPAGSGISPGTRLPSLSGLCSGLPLPRTEVVPPVQGQLLGSVPARGSGAIAGSGAEPGPCSAPPCTQGQPGLRAPLQPEQPQLPQPFLGRDLSSLWPPLGAAVPAEDAELEAALQSCLPGLGRGAASLPALLGMLILTRPRTPLALRDTW